MTYFDDIWRVWWKGPGGSYVELGTLASRNVVGSALVSATAEPSPYYGGYPVVLRCEVLDRNGSQATVSTSIVLVTDVNYNDSTLYPAPTGIAVETGVALTSLFPGAAITLSSTCAVGDIFEVGEGYSWDSVNVAWVTQRAFGILPQGEFGNIHTMKVKNVAARARAYVSVGWSNNGTAIMQAREIDGIWKGAAESPLLVTGADGVLGYIEVDEEFEIEFRPLVPSGTTAADNPIEIDVWINGEEV